MTDEKTDKPFEDRILFIDLETTGLDARTEVPLEIAVVLATKAGEIVYDYSALVWEDTPEFTKPVANIRDNKLEPVFTMHIESGLWGDLDTGHQEADPEESDIVTREEASTQIIKILRGCGVEERTLPIAGLSIGSLDRPFLQHHFPALNKFLSHRNIDISSIREICKRINPELQESIEAAMDKSSEKVTHRATDDCFFSIDLYLHYLESFFYSGD